MKYSYVIPALPIYIAEEVSGLIMETPAHEPYTKLKDALITRTAVSNQKRLDELLSSLELGDRTPSQLLRHMRHLLGNRTLDESILRQLWVKRRTREILAVVPRCTIDELAVTADKM